jgi:hypothetical protein
VQRGGRFERKVVVGPFEATPDAQY